MQEIPETRDSLILGIREAENGEAWAEFVDLYRPVIYRIAISKGLQHADALDVVQTVFISIAKSIERWKKQGEQVRFRNWLLTVAKNATINAVTRKSPLRTGHAELESFAESDESLEDSDHQLIELEYKRELFLRASEEVRSMFEESTWQAFEMTTVKGHSVAEAAKELSKSVGAVYTARSRVMKQLMECVSRLEDAYDE